MHIDTPRATLPIAAGHSARLQNARGTRLRVRSGTAWITLDNDRRDIVLEAGEAYTVDSDARRVICGLPQQQCLLMDAFSPAAQAARAPRQANYRARLANLVKNWWMPASPMVRASANSPAWLA